MTGLAERRRVQLAAGLLLALASIAMLYLFNAWWRGPSDASISPGQSIVTAALIAFVLAYGIVRSRWPIPGIWLVVLVPWLAIIGAWRAGLPGPDPEILFFSVIPIILGGLLLKMRAATGFAGVNLLGIELLLADPAATEVGPLDAGSTTALLFVLTVSVLTLIGSGFLERSLREQEKANERMQVAEAERTQLLHVIAHDLAAPISPIMLRLDLLRMTLGEERHLPVIQRNLDHMVHLIEDVKDLARIEGGRLGLEKRPVDLATLVRDVTEGFQETAKEQHVRPEVETADHLPTHADPDRLNQVLYNLLTNAIKFSPQGGIIQVRAWRNDGHARVEVRDEGRGLAAEELPRLFRPFSQVHDRQEVKEKGTGLGLYISKGIIEAHGGRIWAESEGLGKGSRFQFELPTRALA